MRGDDETDGNKPLSKAEQDRDDLANEMAGREVGRPKRFLPEDANPASQRKRRETEREFQSRLMALLQSDPEYAVLYNDTMDRLREAEAATEIALAEAEQALHQANQDHEDILDRASTLPDGTKVFRDAEGNVRTADGRLVEGNEFDSIGWQDSAPSYEEFVAKKRALADAQATYDAILLYQTDVLGTARHRLTDEANPVSMEELKAIQRQFEEATPLTQQRAPDLTTGAPDMIQSGASDVKVPPIGG